RTQGMHVEAVCVVGCLEGEFPGRGGAVPLVSLDALTDPMTPSERTALRLADERALFRMAISRAPRTVLFASTSTGARTPRTPTRFAARIVLEWRTVDAEAHDAAPSTSLRTMEAGLRRRLADSSVDAPRRLAAAAALAEVHAEPA